MEALSRERLKYFLEFEGFMQRLGLSIHCTYCTRAFGPPMDGVRMTVSSDYKEFHIECNHCNRTCLVDTPLKIAS